MTRCFLTVHRAAVQFVGDNGSALDDKVLGVIIVKAAVGPQRVLGTVCGHEQRGIDKDIVIMHRPLLFCIGRDARDTVVKIQPSAGVDTIAFRLRGDRASFYKYILRGGKRVVL